MWEASLAGSRRLAEEHPADSRYHGRVGASLSNLGVLAQGRGDLKAAREMLEEALTHQKRALAKLPVYHLAPGYLETHYRVLGSILKAQHDDEALAAMEKDRAARLAPPEGAAATVPAE